MLKNETIHEVKNSVLYVVGVAVLAVGIYSTVMTAVKVALSTRYPLAVAGFTNAPIYPDSEEACEQMWNQTIPGMTEDEKNTVRSSQEKCAKRVAEQRREARSRDIAHSVLLLGIGASITALGQKKNI